MLAKITQIEDRFSKRYPKLYTTVEGVSFILMISTIFAAYIVWGPHVY